jgi:hypothetical protein
MEALPVKDEVDSSGTGGLFLRSIFAIGDASGCARRLGHQAPPPVARQIQTREPSPMLTQPGAFRVGPGIAVEGARRQESEEEGSVDRLCIGSSIQGTEPYARIDEVYLVDSDLVIGERPDSSSGSPPPLPSNTC